MSKSKDDLYRFFRIVGAKNIDRWFYEKGDSRRTHDKVYETFILPLYGVCKDSFFDYRHASDDLLKEFPQPPYVEVPLWNSAFLVKHSSPAEANRFFVCFQRLVERAVRQAQQEQAERTLKADTVMKHLTLVMNESMQVSIG